MTAEQFAYWMQGFAELSGDEPPTPTQWKSMREHLALVFKKVTPPFDNGARPTPYRTDLPPIAPFDYQRPHTGSPWVLPATVTCTC